MLAHDADGVRARYLRQRGAYRRLHILRPGVFGFNKMRHHLGIRVRLKCVPLANKARLEFPVILNNPVVDNGDAPFAVRVRVRVVVRRSAMCGPPRMRDDSPARCPQTVQVSFKVREFAFFFADGDA